MDQSGLEYDVVSRCFFRYLTLWLWASEFVYKQRNHRTCIFQSHKPNFWKHLIGGLFMGAMAMQIPPQSWSIGS
jgi:hypothetical protein